MRIRKVNGYWRAIYKDGRGKWRSKSTGQTTLPEAEAVVRASRIKEIEDAGHAVRLTASAFNSIVTDGTTLWAALKEFPAHLTAMGRSPTTTRCYTAHVRQFANGLDGGDSIAPAAVKLPEIASFVNAPDISLSTRRLRHAALHAFWQFCLGSGWVHSNPCLLTRATHDGLSQEQREGRQRDAFTEDEVQRILNKLFQDYEAHVLKTGLAFGVREDSNAWFWCVNFLIAIETGLRAGDIRQLQWSSIVMENGIPARLVVWTDKANRRVELPVSARLAEFLKCIPRVDPIYCFPWQRAGGFSAHFFARLCASLGISKSFHSARHYFASKLASSGLPMATIMERMGHLSPEITAKYVHLPAQPNPWHGNGDNIVKFGQ